MVFSYARGGKKLERLAREAGGNSRAGTPGEAARDADALLLAVHWSRADDVLQQAGDVSGKVIVSCSLPMNADNTDLVVATPPRARRSWPKSGLIRDVGFDPVDAGTLRTARYMEPFAMLVAYLAYEGDGGPELAYRLERFEPFPL